MSSGIFDGEITLSRQAMANLAETLQQAVQQ